ncbi:MAG: LCP family protein [Sporomusaceae bacterium]|nr:LCP family protein [Sporomusaceae bacterium]
MAQDIPEGRLAKRKSKRKRNWLFVISFFLLAFVVGVGAAYFWADDTGQSVITRVVPDLGTGKVNILVLGVDERDDDVGRSDTAFVVTIDKDQKKVTMLSIPRDSRVKIPGHGWDKMNHAYAFGGVKLSKAAVEGLIGIPIDHTVTINFNGFVRMIDAIGGVTIDVEKAMHYSDPYDDNGGLYINLQPGVQHLNGRTAIEYVRYRDEEGDIGRVARQQKFLKAVMQEFTNPQIITRLPELVKEFSKAVRTDMSLGEMVKLAPIVDQAAKSGLETAWVEGTPLWIQDVSYWLPDIKGLWTKIAQIQGIPMDEKYRQAMEKEAAEYSQSVPKEIKVADTPAVVKRSVQQQTAATTKKASDEKAKEKVSGAKVASSNLNGKTSASQSLETSETGTGETGTKSSSDEKTAGK